MDSSSSSSVIVLLPFFSREHSVPNTLKQRSCSKTLCPCVSNALLSAGDLLEDWQVFPLELKDTGLIPFPTQVQPQPHPNTQSTPTFFRQVQPDLTTLSIEPVTGCLQKQSLGTLIMNFQVQLLGVFQSCARQSSLALCLAVSDRHQLQ